MADDVQTMPDIRRPGGKESGDHVADHVQTMPDIRRPGGKESGDHVADHVHTMPDIRRPGGKEFYELCNRHHCGFRVEVSESEFRIILGSVEAESAKSNSRL